LNHLSLGRPLEDDDEEDGEEVKRSALKFREETKGDLDSSMMWRLLAKNSVITCSILAGSEREFEGDDAISIKLKQYGNFDCLV